MLSLNIHFLNYYFHSFICLTNKMDSVWIQKIISL